MMYYLYDQIIFNGHTKKSQVGFGIAHPAGAVFNWHLGSGSVIQDYGSADSETIFTDSQHCFPHPCTQSIHYH
jgi:hypothetical protein